MKKSSRAMIRHAGSMMAGTMVSRVLGVIRESVTAALFGATAGLDAFFVAFALSNMARQLLAEGALSAAFVPVFSDALKGEDGRTRAQKLISQAATLVFCVGVLVVAAGILFAPQLTRLMAPGFEGDQFNLAVRMTRWMFPFLLLVSVAALAMAALNSLGRFFTSSLAPALSNFIFIVVTLSLASRWGLFALVWAVLAGGVAQMGLQIWWLAHREKMVLRPAAVQRQDPDVRRMIRLFVPFALGLSLNQLNPVLTRAFGSFLEAGSISVLNYSNRVIQLPLGLIVIAISQALLPALSRASQDREGFGELLSDALAFTAVLVLPLTALTMIGATPVCHFLFMRGAFGQTALQGTASTLYWSSLGLPAIAANTVFLRALYALEYKKAPLYVAGCNLVLLFAGCFFLGHAYGVDGLAMAGTIAFAGSALLGWMLVRYKMNVQLTLRGQTLGWMLLSNVALVVYGKMLIRLWSYPWNSSILIRGCWLLALGLGGFAVFAAVFFTFCPQARGLVRRKK